MIQTIQMLRFAAAMWVAVYHAQLWGWFPHAPQWLQTIAAGGYAGVDIFFVISGVIMALGTVRSAPGIRTASQFALVRFGRIYTGWWPVMGISLLALTAIGSLPANVDLLPSALLYPSNFSLHISNVIWTLVYELYFYLLVAAGLLLAPPWRQRAMAALAGGIAVLVFYFWCTGRYAPSAFDRATPLVWFYAAPLVLEFFAGYFLYLLVQRLGRQHWGWWLLAAAVLAGMAAYVARFHSPHAPGMSGFFHWPERALWVGSAAVALVGAALLAPLPRSRRLRSLQHRLACLGDYSFAIYLLHPLVFVLADRALQALGWQALPRAGAAVAVLLLLATLAALYHHAIERPLYQAYRRQIARWLGPFA
ncbi:peptidoglycan/LPS O-acetylase OafA/YrhL [Comamonas odontotermitis]|uniref:Peptidoglycan/LPS O-acetylase OafA/YrhL n=1 Tax=Comamonas odontotermitis TaxID=379895 RepID=A0ABR6REW1_9BURK|nr:acyltransferase family protein [Comamonas odontotermitis]MBB6577691.1 peptidoglycan/LPS O-acetylase OafA/YrhL [Comamonas odontotermitis]